MPGWVEPEAGRATPTVFTQILQGNVLFSGKIYTAGKKITQPLVATVVTNFKSGRAPSTPRFTMIVVDLQR